jgi:predicted benzoate:H+ symporter BenE
MNTEAIRAECIALIRGAGGIPAAVEHAAQALGISQAEARRWVHSLGAAKPETLICPLTPTMLRLASCS